MAFNKILRCMRGLLLLWLAAGHAVYASYPVFDTQNLMQMLTENVATIEQWGVDNQQQIAQLNELVQSNTLAKANSTLNFGANWEMIDKARAETFALVNAASTIWQQFGRLSRLIADMKSADAWMACARSGSCSFERYLQDIDEATVKIAQVAAEQAERMQTHLGKKAQVLQELKAQGQSAQGHADILDNLSQISSETAASLIDLNGQSTQLISLITKDQAQQADERQAFMAQEQYFELADGWKRQPHFDLTLPSFK